MRDFPTNPFWNFSLAVYAREGVSRACLALQEGHGLDVNLLLFCGWAGSRGQLLTPGDIGALVESTRPWQEAAVEPLRRLRRWLKDQTAAPVAETAILRERVKAVELLAEAVEQLLLAQTSALPAGEGGPSLAAANLNAYLAVLGVTPDSNDTADLAAVLAGCWPELKPLDAVWLLAGGDPVA
jgi:uncharacterized protein (TIGR02444 family)